MENSGSENVTLDYSFFGEDMFVRPNGLWRWLSISIHDDKLRKYTVDLKVFISINTPPEAGLQGTIGLAQTTEYFQDYSFMYQI